MMQAMKQSAADFILDTATDADFEAIKSIFFQVIEEGETYSYERESLSDEWIRDYWLKNCVMTLVARCDGVVAGVCAIRVNRAGRGSHVANASYIVDARYRGCGIGRALGQASLRLAKEKGFRAMQFNFVVSTNMQAVKLWQSLGIEIVGTLPGAFRHLRHGFVDAYVMHKVL